MRWLRRLRISGTITSAVITATALALAGVHVARPQVNIDSITLALVAIAFLPWLAPVIKSVTLPGGVGLELRDVRQQLEQVSERVSRVERFVFSGPIAEREQKQLRQKLEEFSAYIERLGFPSVSQVPSITVTDEAIGSVFDPTANEITLSKFLIHDPEFLLHEYVQSVLVARLGDRAIEERDELAFNQIESGVALYLPCSFIGRPVFGSEDAARGFGVKTPYVATLENSLRLKDVPKDDDLGGHLAAGQVWGAVLWSLRTEIGEDRADPIIAKAWIALGEGVIPRRVAREFSDRLSDEVVATAGAKADGALRANLGRRGLDGSK